MSQVSLVSVASAVLRALEAHRAVEPVVEAAVGCLRNLSIPAANAPALRALDLDVQGLTRDAMALYPACDALQQWGRAVLSRL